MDKLQVAGSQLRNPPVKFQHERWLHLAIDQHPACPNRARLELWPRKWFLLGQNCWSIYSLDLVVHVDRRRWRSHQLTSHLKRCLLFRKCLRWSSRKAVSVPTSVIGGLGAPQRLAILLKQLLEIETDFAWRCSRNKPYRKIYQLSITNNQRK